LSFVFYAKINLNTKQLKNSFLAHFSFNLKQMFNISKKNPKILFVASEAAPFVKIGGLGEVMYSLSKALRELKFDTRVMIPKYATIDGEKFPLILEMKDIRPYSGGNDPYNLLVSNVLRYENGNGRIIAYFLENAEYYEKRANVYGYNDDTARWVLLSRGVLEFVKKSKWKPDIIIACDWQAGFIPNLLKTEYKDDPDLNKIKVIFSIHNLKFQGMFDQYCVSEMDFDAGQGEIPDFFDEKLLKLSGMRRGIMYADLISTVSPTYSKEILSPEYGEKLEELLVERRSVLFGILNGIDKDAWNPATDDDIASNYSASNMEGRVNNKLALQKHFSLPENKDKFVIGIISRMDEQKGFNLIVEIIDSLMKNIDFQLVVTGAGESRFRNFFQDLQKKYPERVAGHFLFDGKVAKMILAGSDTLLIPSRFEPCGLVQMEAMRYGAIPIVRKTGGLADSVEDYVSGQNKGDGFVFENYDKYALLIAIIRAVETFKNKKEWAKLIARAMAADFFWKKSAKEYIRLFTLAQNLDQEEKSNQVGE
jgi:starch synthase